MACGDCKRRNYSTTKNKKKTTERLEMSKFCASAASTRRTRERSREILYRSMEYRSVVTGSASVSKTRAGGSSPLTCNLRSRLPADRERGRQQATRRSGQGARSEAKQRRRTHARSGTDRHRRKRGIDGVARQPLLLVEVRNECGAYLACGARCRRRRSGRAVVSSRPVLSWRYGLEWLVRGC